MKVVMLKGLVTVPYCQCPLGPGDVLFITEERYRITKMVTWNQFEVEWIRSTFWTRVSEWFARTFRWFL